MLDIGAACGGMCPICIHMLDSLTVILDGIVEGHKRDLGGHRHVKPPDLLQKCM